MAKIKQDRETVKQLGAKYGWEWSESTGLYYNPSEHDQSHADQWQIINDAKKGDKDAVRLMRAIDRIAKDETYQALYTLRRKRPTTDRLEMLYRASAEEVLQRQYLRLRETADFTKRQLQAQNVFRASSSQAFRQTPRQRASTQGFREKRKHVAEKTHKALTSGNAFARLQYTTEEEFERLRRLAPKLGIDFDYIFEKNLNTYGDIYKAMDNTYLQLSETIVDLYRTGDMDLEYFLMDEDFIYFASEFGFDLT